MSEKKDNSEWGYSRRFWVQAIILGLLICGIGFSTQRTAEHTKRLSEQTIAYAQQTQDCLNQLLTTSAARSRLNSDRDDLSEHQRFEFLAMFQALLSPPPGIAKIDQNDPRYQKWAKDTVRIYVTSIAADQRRVEDIKAELNAHPIPAPTCGNKLPGQ